MLPTRAFYFLRHGETQFNHERRFQGHVDVPLNDTGLSQAGDAAKVLSACDFTRIVSSPARRVLQTATPVSEQCGVPIHVEDELMEFFVGSLEGKCIATTLEAHGLKAGDSFLSILPNDADHWHEFAPRVCAAVRRWTDRYADETLLIASHGLVFHALANALVEEQQFSLNAVPYHFTPDGEGWRINAIE
jgi:broad specificity phosphatase PhoE